MNKISLLAACLLTAAIFSSSARAADNRGIYAAANEYRNAVVIFEKVIQNVPGIKRVDERAVDKFEEATKRLRVAARNPRHDSRLRNEWRTIQPMQFEVEARIFEKYTLNHEIYRAWRNVLFARDIFYEEYVYQLDNSTHGGSVKRRIMRSRPERFIPPPPAGAGRLYDVPR